MFWLAGMLTPLRSPGGWWKTERKPTASLIFLGGGAMAALLTDHGRRQLALPSASACSSAWWAFTTTPQGSIRPPRAPWLRASPQRSDEIKCYSSRWSAGWSWPQPGQGVFAPVSACPPAVPESASAERRSTPAGGAADPRVGEGAGTSGDAVKRPEWSLLWIPVPRPPSGSGVAVPMPWDQPVRLRLPPFSCPAWMEFWSTLGSTPITHLAASATTVGALILDPVCCYVHRLSPPACSPRRPPLKQSLIR